MNNNGRILWGSAGKKVEEIIEETKNDAPPAPPNNSGGSVETKGTRIYFWDEVSDSSVLSLIKELREAEKNAEQTQLILRMAGAGNIKIPINLHIHSYGGSLLAGFAAYDQIDKMNVHTHVEGVAASAASIMSVSGKHRTISKNSFILIHQLSSGCWGKYEDFVDNKKNLDGFMNKMKKMYSERTKIPSKVLDDILKHDLYFDANKCLKYGLVDEVV